jgi:hypothetical protein
MKSMYTFVELKRIDFTAVPTFALRAQLAQSLAQVANNKIGVRMDARDPR